MDSSICKQQKRELLHTCTYMLCVVGGWCCGAHVFVYVFFLSFSFSSSFSCALWCSIQVIIYTFSHACTCTYIHVYIIMYMYVCWFINYSVGTNDLFLESTLDD